MKPDKWATPAHMGAPWRRSARDLALDWPARASVAVTLFIASQIQEPCSFFVQFDAFLAITASRSTGSARLLVGTYPDDH